MNYKRVNKNQLIIMLEEAQDNSLDAVMGRARREFLSLRDLFAKAVLKTFDLGGSVGNAYTKFRNNHYA